MTQSSGLFNIDEAIKETSLLHANINCTLLETLIHLFDWFSSHPSLSKEAFSKNLLFWHSILPEGNLLPTNYQQAYNIIKPYLEPIIVYHVCVNDCILFCGKYEELDRFPKCDEPRYKQKKNPRRTFNYLPLGPRLERRYGLDSISYLLQSHQGECQIENQVMCDIQDSPSWKRAYAENGTFHGDPRGVSLSLCLDGLNPYRKE